MCVSPPASEEKGNKKRKKEEGRQGEGKGQEKKRLSWAKKWKLENTGIWLPFFYG